MNRKGKVFYKKKLAGILEETQEGTYRFTYDRVYRQQRGAQPISLTLPLGSEPYEDTVLLPFFDGLIAEGWLLDLAVKHWKIDPKDRMGLLIASCHDCIGAVHVELWEESEAQG